MQHHVPYHPRWNKMIYCKGYLYKYANDNYINFQYLGNSLTFTLIYIQYVKMKLGLSCNKRNIKYLNSILLDYISYLVSNSLEPTEHFTIGWLALICVDIFLAHDWANKFRKQLVYFCSPDPSHVLSYFLHFNVRFHN